MDKMDWAVWALEYLRNQRRAIHEDFNGAMGELRGYPGAHRDSWYGSAKNILSTLYGFSEDFCADIRIPSEEHPSPDAFEESVLNYRAWVQKMADELNEETAKYEKAHKVDGAPFVVEVTSRQVASIIAALDYVIAKRPAGAEPPVDPVQADLQLIAGLARRFHEAVLSLQKHPHGGQLFEVADEWDSQYLFRSILAAYFPDVREEEWSPSVAGSAGRCEFFIKALDVMIELKYARKATDAKKFKTELATDFLDYGGNPQVRRVICLVYDPKSVIKAPAAFQDDLSGPKTNLDQVDVILSPPRD